MCCWSYHANSSLDVDLKVHAISDCSLMAASLRPQTCHASVRNGVRVLRPWGCRQGRRNFQVLPTSNRIPDYGLAFDIDGVLIRSAHPIAGAGETLSQLQRHRVPFICLTNGGGKSEAERVADLQDKLGVSLDIGMFMQSHTPFADMNELHDRTVLIVGGDYDKCRGVAEGYGFRDVVTPIDIVCALPDIWPFAKQYMDLYKQFARPLRKRTQSESILEGLKIDAIFVYNDPRDWGLDATIILDALLSRQGYLGTLSSKNGDTSIRNNGYQQDGQPALFYSNPDLWWAASYPLNRLGQGGFQAAFEGLWKTVTDGAELEKTIIGKPHRPTYEFAERLLRRHRKTLCVRDDLGTSLRRVYMIGDNPESDIRGANNYESPYGTKWHSILVRTGVYKGGEPSCKPDVIVDDVRAAVEWATEHSRRAE